MNSEVFKTFGSGDTVILLHAPFTYAERYAKEIPARIVAVQCGNPNAAFSPWPAPAVFSSAEDFSGGADAHLRFLMTEVLPACQAEHYMIGGYSLAGLFALYAACREPIFEAVACVSGSLWFPGFSKWLHTAPVTPKTVYLSVGDREKRSRKFEDIEERMFAARDVLRQRGAEVSCTLEKGGHFTDPYGRVLRALQYLTEEKK